jgi:hypothetical protein
MRSLHFFCSSFASQSTKMNIRKKIKIFPTTKNKNKTGTKQFQFDALLHFH